MQCDEEKWSGHARLIATLQDKLLIGCPLNVIVLLSKNQLGDAPGD